MELFIQLQHQLCKAAVIPAGAKGVRQLLPPRVQLVVKALQRPVQNPLAHQSGLALIQHPKVRCQSVTVSLPGQKVGVFSQKRRAECVYRLDVRLIDPQKLPFQMRVPRRLRQPLGKLRGDFAPQLRRSRLRIGNHQEIINVIVLLRYVEEQPLH